MKIGVCAIHGDFAHKWIVDGNGRECEYCGKRQSKKIKLVEKIVWTDENCTDFKITKS